MTNIITSEVRSLSVLLVVIHPGHGDDLKKKNYINYMCFMIYEKRFDSESKFFLTINDVYDI